MILAQVQPTLCQRKHILNSKTSQKKNKAMKITFLVLLVILCSCNSPSENIEPEKSYLEIDYDIADMQLEYDAEKIGLIAIIKNVPHEKANSVLRDYLAKTFGSVDLAMKSPDFVVKVVDTIAKNYDLSTKMTASIIFSYQYEMITRDEILEESRNQMADYESEQY